MKELRLETGDILPPEFIVDALLAAAFGVLIEILGENGAEAAEDAAHRIVHTALENPPVGDDDWIAFEELMMVVSGTALKVGNQLAFSRALAVGE